MHSAPSNHSLLAKGFILLIRLYQRVFSGLFGPRCIYTPSCSEYSARAIARFGLLRGIVVAFFRIIRCVPRFYVGGDDPVIQRFSMATLFGALKPSATRHTTHETCEPQQRTH